MQSFPYTFGLHCDKSYSIPVGQERKDDNIIKGKWLLTVIEF